MGQSKGRASQLVRIPPQSVEGSILLVRRKKVILDASIAALYGVETKYLVRAMKRNIERFPPTSCSN